MSYTPNRSSVSLADGPQLDSFGRLRVSQSNTLFDSQQEYGLDTLRYWDASANGTLSINTAQSNGSVTNGSNAVGPRNLATRHTPITVSTTNGHYAVLQSRQYVRYIPGKSHLIFITGVFAPASDFGASFVRRTSTSGSVVDTAVVQADWNVDKLDGTGVSGITIDFTKAQILYIQAQWLGTGRVTVGFDINGILYPVHHFLNANSLTVPYTQTFNLPVRMETRNISATTTVARSGYFDSENGIFLEMSKTGGSPAGGSIHFGCCSVQSESGSEQRGAPQSSPVGISTVAVTTRRPVLSIRPKALFNLLNNRAHIENITQLLRATTNDSMYEVVLGGTLTGASWVPVGTVYTAGAFVTGLQYIILSVGTTNFTLIGASANTIGVIFTATGAGTGTGTVATTNSVTEYDSSATAISGGEVVAKGFAISGSGAIAQVIHEEADLRHPLVISKIDALAVTQPAITIVCTSFGGTSNVTALMNWHEQVI